MTPRCNPIASLAILLVALPACEGGSGSPHDTGDALQFDVAMSELERDTSPDVDEAELDELVVGNTAFAARMYQTLAAAEQGDFLFSPLSISYAIAMTWAGARGSTEEQMAETMHFTLGQDDLHPAFNALDLALAGRLDEAVDMDVPFQLNLVNAIWGQEGYPFMDDFLDVLALNYGAGLNILDFYSDPDGSREIINTWVEEQTEERIQDLLAPRTITSSTRLVLTNAIYMNAAWYSPFEEGSTTDQPFYTLEGGEVTVPTMYQEEVFLYVQGEDYQAVELFYDGAMLSMLLIAPTRGTFESFEEALDGELLDTVMASLFPRMLDLYLPKFGCESAFSLKVNLQDMGMTEAFTPGLADFSGMVEQRELYISEIAQKTFLDVDELGTEAAAATAVVVDVTGGPGETTEMRLDRPFVYFILDVPSSSVLFLGRVLDPS